MLLCCLRQEFIAFNPTVKARHERTPTTLHRRTVMGSVNPDNNLPGKRPGFPHGAGKTSPPPPTNKGIPPLLGTQRAHKHLAVRPELPPPRLEVHLGRRGAGPVAPAVQDGAGWRFHRRRRCRKARDAVNHEDTRARIDGSGRQARATAAVAAVQEQLVEAGVAALE